MQNPFFRLRETFNYNDALSQKKFAEDTTSDIELMQKELSVNREEQLLLKQRVSMQKDFLSDLSAIDPQYSMLTIQLKMDAIELDELKVRETLLIQRISELK